MSHEVKYLLLLRVAWELSWCQFLDNCQSRNFRSGLQWFLWEKKVFPGVCPLKVKWSVWGCSSFLRPVLGGSLPPGSMGEVTRGLTQLQVEVCSGTMLYSGSPVQSLGGFWQVSGQPHISGRWETSPQGSESPAWRHWMDENFHHCPTGCVRGMTSSTGGSSCNYVGAGGWSLARAVQGLVSVEECRALQGDLSGTREYRRKTRRDSLMVAPAEVPSWRNVASVWVPYLLSFPFFPLLPLLLHPN